MFAGIHLTRFWLAKLDSGFWMTNISACLALAGPPQCLVSLQSDPDSHRQHAQQHSAHQRGPQHPTMLCFSVDSAAADRNMEQWGYVP